MSLTCPNCYQQNTSHARFCERCGAALPQYARGPRSNPIANLALVAAVAVSLLTAVSALNSSRAPWQHRWDPFTDPVVFSAPGERFSRDYDLGEYKAQAMLDLLKPADVSVTVGKNGSRISITGRAWEVDAIDSLVELVMRKHGQDKDTVAEYIDRALDASRTSEKYRLPKHKREALHHILAFDDVPVISGHKSKRVRATREDQETIRAVVDILRGKRSRCEGIGCLLGFHSWRCRIAPQDRLPRDIEVPERITVPPVPEPPSDR